MSFPSFSQIPGIKLADGPERIKLDLFFDLQCPYSKKSWDSIRNSIQKDWSKKVNIFFHPICLSHHRQSWDLTRAFFAIKKLNNDLAFEFINLIYSDHEQFYNASWKSKNQDEFLSHIAKFAERLPAISADKVLENIEDDQIYYDAKKSIHYAATKQVWSTPSFFINETAASDLSSSSSLSDWNEKISKLKV